MIKHMANAMKQEILGASIQKSDYVREMYKCDDYEIHNADCIDLASEIESR